MRFLRLPDGTPDRNSEELRYPNAISVRELRAILELTPSGVDVSNDRCDAVARLEEIATVADWKSLTTTDCHAGEVRFALAVQSGDRTDPVYRLKAMVCRAYDAASRYAEAFAQDVVDGARSGSAKAELQAALHHLIGPHAGPPELHFEGGEGPLQRVLRITERFWRNRGKDEDEIAQGPTTIGESWSALVLTSPA